MWSCKPAKIEARLLEESPSSAHQFPKSREVWAESVREADPAREEEGALCEMEEMHRVV